MNLFEMLFSIKSLLRTFDVRDVIDICLIAFLIYQAIKLIRESRAGQLVKGLLILSATYFLASIFEFKMMSTILSHLFEFSIFGLIIVFQPELRRALEQIGRSKIKLANITSDESIKTREIKDLIDIICKTAENFSKKKLGALIVFEKETKLGEIISTGTIIKAQPSYSLLSNIFFNKAPLHDGAVIVKDSLIWACGCILPLTKNERYVTGLGTRHRAAIGISENSDAIALVISEETGEISLAQNGIIKRYKNIENLKNDLKNLLLETGETTYVSFINKIKKVKENG